MFDNIHIPEFEDIYFILKQVINSTYDYIYPFLIKYILLIKLYPLESILLLVLIFHISYFSVKKINKEIFSLFSYTLSIIILPLSAIYYSVIFIDALLKKIIHMLFWLQYPYVSYKVRRDLELIEKAIKRKDTYNNSFIDFNPNKHFDKTEQKD